MMFLKNSNSKLIKHLALMALPIEFLLKQAGVPHGSTLGPLLVLIYINDIVDDIQADMNLFADDPSLPVVVGDPAGAGTILQNFSLTQRWLVKFNSSKSDSLVISHKHVKPNHPSSFYVKYQDSVC